MSKTVRETLIERANLIRKTIEETEKKQQQFPEGHISIKNIHGKPYYYYSKPGSKEKHLTNKDDELIKQLLQKSYFNSALKAFKRELEALETMQQIYPEALSEDIFVNLPEARKKYVEPIILGDAESARRWMSEPYVMKPFKNDAPVYKTLRGERVRSKSEVMIADRLYARGVPYKYECPIVIDGKVIHPDFATMRMSDNKIIYHEHCGMMDNPGYVNDLVERVNLYNQAGILQGDRLTFSFETSDRPLDIRVIDRLIDEFFK